MRRILRHIVFVLIVLCLHLFFMFTVSSECVHTDDKAESFYTEISKKEPTCTEGGYTLFICNLCGDFYDGFYTEPLGHNFKADENCSNLIYNQDMSHSYYCHNGCGSRGTEKGGINATENCSFLLTSETGPTCAKQGEKIYTCKICNRTRIETIPVATDTCRFILTSTVSPTCKTQGKKTYTCENCNRTRIETIPVAVDTCKFILTSILKSTCTAQGKNKYTCEICKRTKEEKIPVTSHNYKKSIILPTCTQGGYTLYTCSGCGKKYKDDLKEPVTHISDGGILTVLPTEKENGVLRFSCRICDKVLKTETVPKYYKFVENTVKNFKTASFTSTSVKLKWSNKDKKVKFKVYYSTDRESWKSVTTEKEYITVENLASARRYYFRISVITDNIESPLSKTVSVYTRPLKVKSLKVKSAEKGIASLSWKQVSKADGYEISFASSDSFKKNNTSIITVSSGKTLKKSVKKLKSGKKFSFRVRAYKTVGGEKVFGVYSEIKSVKIK